MNKEWKIILYETLDGKCPVNDFINKLDDDEKRKIITYIEYLEEIGIDMRRPQGDYLRDGIHELRIKLSGKETRTLYFFCYENYIVLTHIFVKTTDKVPESEIDKALKYKENFLQRFNKNNIDEVYNATRFYDI